MSRAGRFSVLVAAEHALAPSVRWFANDAQGQVATQAYTRQQAVADGSSVAGNIFNSVARGLIDGCTAIGGAYPRSQSPQSWAQLSARVPHDDLIWSGVESPATGPVYPNNLHPAVEAHILDKASNGAIGRSADGASQNIAFNTTGSWSTWTTHTVTLPGGRGL